MSGKSLDYMLGSAVQLIKDIERVAFLGDIATCSKIQYMAKVWLKEFEMNDTGNRIDGAIAERRI